MENRGQRSALGWWLTPEAGNTIIKYSRGIDVAVAKLTMVKNKKYGVVALNELHIR